ncbi:MAG TPA: hypothetical protein VGD98_10560 [Ktedonobacteraceae bacterium]
MIDPHWELVDLDPLTWRQIGRFFDPGQYLRAAQPGEHGLFILHERGRMLRVVDSQTGVRRDITLDVLDNPQEYARLLYARGEWQRVHVIDKAHLALVARVAQETPQDDRTLDEYYHQVYQLLWGNTHSYVSVPAHPRHWHGWTYEQINHWLSTLPFSPASLALGVFGDNHWLIGLILVCEHGQIRKVTTFEALDAATLAHGIAPETLAALSQQLEETFAPPVGLLLCTQDVFTAWLEQEEKMPVLLTARQQNQAHWLSLSSVQ